jgi:hypothetical protein
VGVNERQARRVLLGAQLAQDWRPPTSVARVIFLRPEAEVDEFVPREDGESVGKW